MYVLLFFFFFNIPHFNFELSRFFPRRPVDSVDLSVLCDADNQRRLK